MMEKKLFDKLCQNCSRIIYYYEGEFYHETRAEWNHDIGDFICDLTGEWNYEIFSKGFKVPKTCPFYLEFVLNESESV